MTFQLSTFFASVTVVLGGDCDCSWTHGGSDCGQDDGSPCWRECCGGGPGPGPSPPGGGGTWCPTLGDFDVEWGNVQGEGNGWRVNGEGGVHGRTSWNLLGGYIEFDWDACGGQQGLNNNFYTVSPSGGMSAGYCDIQGKLGGICMELDIGENNGGSNGQTTWHTYGNHDGGCDQDGCYASYSLNPCKYHMKTEFAEDGGIKQLMNGNEVQVNQHGSLQSSEKGVVANTMNSAGAALISTQWSGWVPGSAASRGHRSHRGETSRNLSSSTADSPNDATFAITNVKVYAPRGIKFGPPPPTCPGPAPTPVGPTPPPPPTPAGTCQTYVGKNNDGTNLKSTADITSSAGECCDKCKSADNCVGYTWVHANQECWLKSAVSAPRDDDCGGCVTSGTFDRPVPTPPTPGPPTPGPPSPSPGPVPGCPGGSLAACISSCPDDDPVVFQVCVHECNDRCGGGSSCTGGDDGSDAASCMANCPSESFADCITCCTKKFPSFI